MLALLKYHEPFFEPLRFACLHQSLSIARDELAFQLLPVDQLVIHEKLSLLPTACLEQSESSIEWQQSEKLPLKFRYEIQMLLLAVVLFLQSEQQLHL